jgi:hypothetical protein
MIQLAHHQRYRLVFSDADGSLRVVFLWSSSAEKAKRDAAAEFSRRFGRPPEILRVDVDTD